MSGKNDRIILGGLIALAVIAVIGSAAIYGIGAFIYMNEPAATPTPAATATPTLLPTQTPKAAPPDSQSPFSMDRLISDKGGRTYTLIIALASDAAPVDMSKVTATITADGQTYPAWDYRHAEHTWSANANGNMLLERGETFTMIVYAPQAGVPLFSSSPARLVLLNDGLPVFTINVTAV